MTWILTSDTLMHALWPQAEAHYIGLLKGFAFVGVTSLILYALLRRIHRSEIDRYRAIFENHHAVMLFIDPESGNILDANPAAAAFYGWPRERLRSMRIGDINPIGNAQWRAVMNRARETGKGVFQFQHRVASGELREVEVRNGPTAIDGKTAIFSIVQDITERRHADEQLRNSEARYRDLFEANPHPMWVCDADTLQILAVNDAAIERYGYSRDEFLRMRLTEIHPAADARKLADVMRGSGVAAGSESIWRQSRKDGSVIEVELSAHDLSFAGRAAKIMHAHDMTAYQRVLRALVEQEAKFRALTEQSLFGVFVLDEGCISYTNPRAAEIFGYAHGELLGHSVLDVLIPEHHARLVEDMRRLNAGEVRDLRNEYTGRRKDGTTVVVGAHGTPTTIGGRRVLFGVVQDITEKMRAEETIQDYVKRLEQSVLGTVDAVSKMVELRDPYTAGHEQRVGELSAAIAAEMGLDENMQRGLRIAGGLHDIGKIVVPAEILSKPGRLSAVEFEMVKSHAQQGYEVLKSIDFPWPVAEVARQHHERLDGSGYPRGLKGDDILLEARIMTVADVVESMASHRPYRPGLGVDKALAEIEHNAGRLYDPQAVAACLRLFREKHYSFDPV